MAQSKQTEKRIRTSDKSRLANKGVSSAMKTAIKKVMSTGSDEDHAFAIKKLDKAAKSGILHANTVARRKSRLAKKVAAVKAGAAS